MNAAELHEKATALYELISDLEREIPTLGPQLPGMELPDLLRTWRLLDWLKKIGADAQEMAGSAKAEVGRLAHTRMVNLGAEGIDFDGCRWRAEVKKSITCPADKADELLVYAKTEDLQLGELIKESIHQKALESYVTGLLNEGKDPPPMVKIFEMETVNCRQLPTKKESA